MIEKKRGRPRKSHASKLVKPEVKPEELRLGLPEEKFFAIAIEKYPELFEDIEKQIPVVDALTYAALYESREHYRLELAACENEKIVDAVTYEALYESREHYRLKLAVCEDEKIIAMDKANRYQLETDSLSRSIKSLTETMKEKEKDYETTLQQLAAQLLEKEEMIDTLMQEVSNFECEGIWMGIWRKIFGGRNEQR